MTEAEAANLLPAETRLRTETDKAEALTKALDRPIRFNRALIAMGAVETVRALNAGLDLAFKLYWRYKP